MASIPSSYVTSVLHNGVGRYVCQLQRITFKFCKSHGSSRGVRDYIEKNLLLFTRSNPGIMVYLKPRRFRTPCLVGEYLNGNMVDLPAANQSVDEISQWVEHLRCRSGHHIIRLLKTWHTDHPSIQGMWTPFTNKPTELNITNFPDNENYRCPPTAISATDLIFHLQHSDNQPLESGKSQLPVNDKSQPLVGGSLMDEKSELFLGGKNCQPVDACDVDFSNKIH